METEKQTQAITEVRDKGSKTCGGIVVSREATARGPNRQAAEDEALKAARAAAQRGCDGKDCETGRCTYVEDSNTGSSREIDQQPNGDKFEATMKTNGECACEGYS